MSLLEQISKEDFDKIITYSQDIPEPQTFELLDNWSKAKQNIVNKFLNGNVQYTYPTKIHFELNDQSKNEKIEYFQEYIQNLFDDYDHPLAKFLKHLSTKEFYANSLTEDYTISERDNKKIQKGSKVIKSFKYFIEDKQLLTDLQNKASEIIQENKVEGYLTFSVHPLDFLSSSENTYNWRSCHALDGEYRAGNLSYMCDQSTMIVYLSGKDKLKLPHFPEDVPWYSKKWRMLLHFDQNFEVCFAGRQYPFFSPGALDKIFEIFSNHMVPFAWGLGEPKKEKWEGWFNDYISQYTSQTSDRTVYFDDERFYILNGYICDKYKTVLDALNSLHFNDITRSSYYTKPYYMFRSYYRYNYPPLFEVGAAVKCLRCGETLINRDDSMMCSNCNDIYGNNNDEDYCICECCGTRFYYDDAYWVGNATICPNCADRETFICDECGDRIYNDEQHYDDGQYICDYCFNMRKENKND